jgi:hypothetical protein
MATFFRCPNTWPTKVRRDRGRGTFRSVGLGMLAPSSQPRSSVEDKGDAHVSPRSLTRLRGWKEQHGLRAS